VNLTNIPNLVNTRSDFNVIAYPDKNDPDYAYMLCHLYVYHVTAADDPYGFYPIIPPQSYVQDWGLYAPGASTGKYIHFKSISGSTGYSGKAGTVFLRAYAQDDESSPNYKSLIIEPIGYRDWNGGQHLNRIFIGKWIYHSNISQED
jgi:hypothetical protein